MTKAAWQKLLRILFIVLMSAALVIYMYWSEGWDNIGNVFSTLDYRFMLLALAAEVLLKLVSAAQDAFMRNRYQKGIPFGWSVYNSFVSDFLGVFSPSTLNVGKITCITCMSKQGLPPSKGTAVMLVGQSCYLASTVIYVSVLVLGGIRYFAAGMNWIVWICFIAAFLIDVVTIFLYIFGGRCDGVITKAAVGIIRFLHVLHIVRDKDAAIVKASREISGFKDIMKNSEFTKFDYVICLAIGILHLFLKNITNFFAALAMGVEIGNVYIFIASLAFFTMISYTVPIPGGFGVNEVLYHTILIPVVGEDHINFMILFYRIVTYYFSILLDAFAFLFKCPTVKEAVKNPPSEI